MDVKPSDPVPNLNPEVLLNWIQIQGESMRPLLHSGDWIEVDWFEKNQDSPTPTLKRGELIVGRFNEGEWVVHRYVGRQKSGSKRPLIKGDASFCWDDLQEGQIWGRVKTLRSESLKKEIKHRAGMLAAWIATLSLGTVPPDTLKARVLRRVIYFLSWIDIHLRRSVR